MSEEKVLCSNHLTIRFDQLEGNRINWFLTPDEKVGRTEALSLIDLAERGAPLSAMAIRALLKLCEDGLIFNAFEQANSIQAEVAKRLAPDLPETELLQLPQGATIN